MYVLIVKYDRKGGAEVFGPFPTTLRANQYATKVEDVREFTVQNLIVPHNVVKTIVWRDATAAQFA